ncbi:PREDICTED: uncharacterized protein LOC109234878 [Nicotiana attenuata]|uniref:uncharacterized protein LOC109234878 n=1 Tax=Nicotiana attenuata TaxID=49451 RepID=UPI00090531D9|nr:PREDICTED: uncharacterized protein LOC109234878 [Nicotiana attenuata]
MNSKQWNSDSGKNMSEAVKSKDHLPTSPKRLQFSEAGSSRVDLDLGNAEKMKERMEHAKDVRTQNWKSQMGLKLEYIPPSHREDKPQVLYHQEGYYVFRFGKREDKEAIMQAEPYTYHNKPLILQNWERDFHFDPKCITTIPLWIQLPNLSVGYWTADALSKVASAVGMPMYTDRYTAELGKISFARILHFGHELIECWKINKKEENEEFQLPRRRNRGRRNRIIQEWKPKEQQAQEETNEMANVVQEQVENEQQPHHSLADQRGKKVINTKENEKQAYFLSNQRKSEEANRFAVLKEMSHEDRTREEEWMSRKLEVKEKSPKKILYKIAKDWGYKCNYEQAENGRIWVIWKQNLSVDVVQVQEQCIHCKVTDATNGRQIMLSVVYARNKAQERTRLWKELEAMGGVIQMPWIISGDFNTVLCSDDRLGQPVTMNEIKDFKECIDTLQLSPVKTKGYFYTWCNKQQATDRVYSRIDWVLGNFEWIRDYGHVEADCLEPGISNHSPIVIQIWKRQNMYNRPFKMYMVTMEHREFKPMVVDLWLQRKNCDPMERIWRKLQDLKMKSKDLNRK